MQDVELVRRVGIALGRVERKRTRGDLDRRIRRFHGVFEHGRMLGDAAGDLPGCDEEDIHQSDSGSNHHAMKKLMTRGRITRSASLGSRICPTTIGSDVFAPFTIPIRSKMRRAIACCVALSTWGLIALIGKSRVSS